MHIALLSYEYPPDTPEGGVATYILQAARVLQRRGHAVELFVGSPRRSGTETEAGVVVHRIQVSARDAFAAAAGSAFAARHRTAPFDVLEGPDFHAEARFATTLVPGIPLVVRLHTPQFLVHRVRDAHLPPAMRERMRRRAVRRHDLPRWNPYSAQHDQERLYLLAADEIVGISQAITRTLTRLWRLPTDRISAIPNPYVPSPDLLAIPLDTRTRTVAFVGRLEVRKGVLALAEAIPHLLRRCPDAAFRFIGRAVTVPRGQVGRIPAGTNMETYLRARLRAFQPQVEFVGPVSADRLPSELSRADVCIFPSLWENFPYVCLEAMAAGRGVIGSRQGGMPEMLDGGSAGLLVHPDNPREMAAALVRLLNAPEERQRFGAAARARVLAEYNADRIGALMEASYARAIRHRKDLGPRRGL